jgi:hypothetical protein
MSMFSNWIKNPVKETVNFFEDTVEDVVDVVKDIGDFVQDDILIPWILVGLPCSSSC